MATTRMGVHHGIVSLVGLTVVLVQLSAPVGAVAQTNEARGWRLEHPVLFSTLIGTAAGASIGCALGAANASYDGVTCPYLAAPFGLLGAAVGVVPGIAIERRGELFPVSLAEVRRRAKPGTRVIVVGADRSQTIGKLVEVGGDTVTMRSNDGTTITLGDNNSKWQLRTDSLTNGIVVGAAVGSALAVVNYKDGAGAPAFLGIPMWALIGALADRAICHQTLVVNEPAARSSRAIQIVPLIGRRSGGFAVQASF